MMSNVDWRSIRMPLRLSTVFRAGLFVCTVSLKALIEPWSRELNCQCRSQRDLRGGYVRQGVDASKATVFYPLSPGILLFCMRERSETESGWGTVGEARDGPDFLSFSVCLPRAELVRPGGFTTLIG